MRHFSVLVCETFLQLARDRVFIPGLLLGMILLAAGYFLRQLSLESEFKVLADIYSATLHLGVGAFALFWGIDLIAGPDKRCAITFRLVGPHSRFGYFLSRYVGLCLCLLFFALPLWGSWQVIGAGEGASFLQEAQYFFSHCLGWFVLAALGMSLATITSFYISIFAGFAFWFCGLVAAPIVHNVVEELSFVQRLVLTQISLRWDLARFALPYPHVADFSLFIYSLALIVILMTLGCLRFRTLDF